MRHLGDVRVDRLAVWKVTLHDLDSFAANKGLINADGRSRELAKSESKAGIGSIKVLHLTIYASVRPHRHRCIEVLGHGRRPPSATLIISDQHGLLLW